MGWLVVAEQRQTRSQPSARAIAEGALFADLTVIVILLGLYVPYAGPVLATISPLPLLLLLLRRGWRVGIQAIVVTTVLVSFLTGPLTAIAAAVIAARAASLAIGMRHGWRVSATVLVGATFFWALLYGGVVGSSLLVPSWRSATEQGITITYNEVSGIIGSLAQLVGQGALWHSVHPELNRFFRWYLQHWLLVLPLLAWPVLVIGVTAEYVIAEAVLPRFGFNPRPIRLPFWSYREERKRAHQVKQTLSTIKSLQPEPSDDDHPSTGGNGADGGAGPRNGTSNIHRLALPVEERVRE